jgi:hypothetical protein
MTTSAEGDEKMQLIAMLTAKRKQSRKDFEALFDSFNKLFTPKEPPPEPPLAGIKPPGQFPLQPPMLPSGGSTGF